MPVPAAGATPAVPTPAKLVINEVAADVYRYTVGQKLRWGFVTEEDLEKDYENPHVTETPAMAGSVACQR